MATPKFDMIAIELMKMVKDEFITAFTPGSGAMPRGDIIRSAEEIERYVNSALLKMFNDLWSAVGGEVKAFTRLVPELAVPRTIAMSSDGTNGYYYVTGTNNDLYELVSVSCASGLGIVGKKELFHAIKEGNVLQYTGTTEKPIALFMESVLYVFPYIASLDVVMIKQPVDPSNGYPLSQNGTYDSPFAVHWTNKIAQVAYALYLTDSTNQT